MINEQIQRKDTFLQLVSLERNWKPWPLWDALFGLSIDHDTILLSEFPLLLTLLCVCFQNSPYSIYFSRKLRKIVEEGERYIKKSDFHSTLWLLIACQIAHTREDFEYASDGINRKGGIPEELFITPSIYFSFESDIDDPYCNFQKLTLIPTYEQWKPWISNKLQVHETDEIQIESIISIIDGLLVMSNWESARLWFARWCLLRTTK